MQIAEGFSQPYRIQGRASVADLFRPGERCGLYVLHFANGDIYAGQALDVSRRYVQHRKAHADIEQISFREVPKNRLDNEERTLIWSLERSGKRLRNITFTSVPKGESDFDLVMSLEEQNRWLEDPSYIDFSGERIVDSELRRKYIKKYESFANLPHSDEILDVLRSYVRAGIPAFLRSEVSFWCVSCLPTRSVYARISIYWQEVLTVFVAENEFWVSLHTANSPFILLPDDALDLLFERHPTLGTADHKYSPGGSDQVNLVSPLTDAQAFISDPEVTPAIRLFNLRLMKKGPCNFARHHCMNLADSLVDV
ncbi:MAG: hypothetical protein WA982_03925 [Rubrobacteraceae bacterium]